MLKVTFLRIKNFMGVSELDIAPGQVTQIVGDNNQGKTTIIKTIDFAVNGSTDGRIVKFGEDSAEVLLELSDNTHIRRRINRDGRQTVDVKRDGFKAPAPQAFLDTLFDPSTLNPIDLLDPKRRAEVILETLDIKVPAARLAEELGIKPNELPPIDHTQHGLKVLDQAK